MLKVIDMGSKLNVVDSNNNFVGFNLEDDCCAHGGYFIAEKEITTDFDDAPKIDQTDFEHYVFDEAYFKDHDGKNDASYDCDNYVIFRLKPEWGHEELPTLFLHLFNVHNGYYAKSFVSLMGYKHELKDSAI